MKKRDALRATLTLATVSIIILALIFFRPGVEQQESDTPAILVTVTAVERNDYPLNFTAYGTVQANREVSLRPEVTGLVVELSPMLVAGGRAKKGDLLLKIDPRDYQNALEQAIAAMQTKELEYKIELGRKVIAEREWELLSPSIKSSDLGRELALREPHLVEKKQALEAAKSAVEKAKIDLERTQINAPFNAIVLQESVEVGQLVSRDTEIAKIAATDEFRVQVSLPLELVAEITLPTQAVINQDNEAVWEGEAVRLLGDLDPNGRMARILVLIKNPLDSRPPLLLGTFVDVKIRGPELKNVIKLPNEILHEGDKVRVAEDGILAIKKVHIKAKENGFAYIDEGLENGALVITSDIAVPLPGMRVKYD